MEKCCLKWVGKVLIRRSSILFRENTRDPKPGATSSYFFKPYCAHKIGKIHSFYLWAGVGWIFLPDNQVNDRTGVTDKPVAEVLTEKHPPIENAIVLCCRRTRKRLFLFWWILRIMWLSQFHGNFWGEQGPVEWTQRLYRGGYQKHTLNSFLSSVTDLFLLLYHNCSNKITIIFQVIVFNLWYLKKYFCAIALHNVLCLKFFSLPIPETLTLAIYIYSLTFYKHYISRYIFTYKQ